MKSQLSTVERQLDEKVYEVTQHVSQLSELEDQLQQVSSALDSCRKQLQQEQASAASTKAANESIKQLHAQQCQDLQQQIDTVSYSSHVALLNIIFSLSVLIIYASYNDIQQYPSKFFSFSRNGRI